MHTATKTTAPAIAPKNNAAARRFAALLLLFSLSCCLVLFCIDIRLSFWNW